MFGVLSGIFLVSAASLLYQLALTRIFSIAEWYHYAFLVVSLALLGYGASGTVAARMESWGRRPTTRWLGKLALGFSVCTLGSYIGVNYIPFDSYALVLEKRQVAYFLARYLALASPFFFAGMVLAVAFREMPQRPGKIYCASMVGSGVGALAMPLLAGRVSAEGLVFAAAGMGLLGTFGLLRRPRSYLALAGAIVLLTLSSRVPGWLEVRSSPYKSLRSALEYPGAEVIERRETATARVEIVRSDGIRSAPGLSYAYEGEMPRQLGVMVDGSNMTGAVIGNDLTFGNYMTGAVAYVLAKPESVLILRPRGGLEVATATAASERLRRILAIEDEPGVRSASTLNETAVASDEVEWLAAGLRSWLESVDEKFDVVAVPLSEDMGVVKRGAFSLTQDYRLTVEGVESALQRLRPNGVLSITRWLQVPPSESIRALDTAAEALRRTGAEDPAEHIVALRSWVTMTIVAKREPFTEREVAAVKEFCSKMKFDLVWHPRITEDEVNIYAEFDEPSYYLAAREILSGGRSDFLKTYDHDVRAVTDDKPFFFHFFKWRQVPELLRGLGKEWLPFGGSGYLFLLISMGAALVGAAVLLLVPAVGDRRRGGAGFLTYFGALGIGFIFVEISLMHRLVLLLDQPTYAFAVVLAALLGASGFGSLLSERLSERHCRASICGVAFLAAAVGLLGGRVAAWGLGLSFGGRLGLALAMIAPMGVLMGMPFPAGLKLLGKRRPESIAWAWAANGAASVVGSVGAVMVSLAAGYGWVLGVGAVAYIAAAIAWVTLTYGRAEQTEQRLG